AAFAPDGKTLVTGAGDGTVRWWEPTSGRQRRCLQTGQGWVQFTAFSPDGQLLATAGSDAPIKLWDGQTGALVRELSGPKRGVYGGGFAGNGRFVAVFHDNSVHTWDVTSGKEIRTFRLPDVQVRAARVSPVVGTLAVAFS